MASPTGQPASAGRTIELQHDNGAIPSFFVPRWLCHDPANPFRFGASMHVLFGLFATFTVSNLYYCQPILGDLASSFHVSETATSNIATLVQAGYATGLLLIAPLGDLVQRRQLILILITTSTCLTIGLAVTHSLIAFEVLSFLVGVASVVPPILVPLAADLASPEHRARSIAVVWAALMTGILFARVLSGVITELTNHRVVYYMATGLQGLVLCVAYLTIPNYPAKNHALSYFRILSSMAKISVTEPLLIQCSLLTILNSACFSSFWVSLTFLLLDTPYHYSTLDIGLFGLLGMLGVVLGPFLGRAMDTFIPWYGSLFATFWLLSFQIVMAFCGGLNVSAVIISTLGLDLFRQVFQVSMAAQALNIDPDARSRINAVLSIAMFAGQVMGTSSSTHVFFAYGWRACFGLSLGLTGLQLLLLILRGPHCGRDVWIGYQGGFRLRTLSSKAARVEECEQKSDLPSHTVRDSGPVTP